MLEVRRAEPGTRNGEVPADCRGGAVAGCMTTMIAQVLSLPASFATHLSNMNVVRRRGATNHEPLCIMCATLAS
jgi:hypothetical protein